MYSLSEIKEREKVQILGFIEKEQSLLDSASKEILDLEKPENDRIRLSNAIKKYKKELKKLNRQLDKLK